MFELKKSGTKVTIKQTVLQSPANVRPVSQQDGRNPTHRHIVVPPSIAKKIPTV
jgi:hypothetical protein